MIRRVLIYAALLAGALVFSWPFIWMAFTSAKLERELFSEHPAGLPQAPRPVLRSPYIDDRVFANVDGPRRDEALQIIDARLRSANHLLPQDLDRERDRLLKQIGLGIYQRCLTVFPPDYWQKTGPGLEQEINRIITPELVDETTAKLHRAFGIGQVRVRSYDLQDQQ